MKSNSLFLIILCKTCQIALGQVVIENHYYHNENPNKVERTIQYKDGTICYEMRNLGDNTLLILNCYKNGFPVGKWISITGEEIDYNFDLQYNDKEYDSLIYYDLETETTIPIIKGNFKPPKFQYIYNDFEEFVTKQFIYHKINKIRGAIIYQFTIDKTGKLTKLSVVKGLDKILDKEGARVIMQSHNWKPATIDDIPINICVKMQLTFEDYSVEYF